MLLVAGGDKKMEYFFVYNNALWIYVFVVLIVLATAVVGVMFVNNIDNYITAITCRPETNT